MQTNNLPRQYLLNCSRDELISFVKDLGIEKYRADQLFKGIYHQLLPNFNTLSTIPKETRLQLDEITILRTLKPYKKEISSLDNTTKFLWQLEDGKYIESVIIYEGKRVTFCISSQVGCLIDCKFCATGKMGFLRNLSSGEIVEQVILMKQLAENKPSNIVFMGMGEPLLNLDNVIKASYIISEPEGLAFPRKKIILSTCGIVPGIRKLADENVPFSLAISLNSAFEDKRKQIMPISYKYPLEELKKVINYYVSKTGKKVTFEYTLIHKFNDKKTDADKLINFTKNIPCKINLIPCNSDADDTIYTPPLNSQIKWFSDYLHDNNRTVTVRIRKGFDIKAACGQLYAENNNKVGKKLKVPMIIN